MNTKAIQEQVMNKVNSLAANIHSLDEQIAELKLRKRGLKKELYIEVGKVQAINELAPELEKLERQEPKSSE